MRTVKQVLIGLFSVIFLLGGVTMVAPFGSEAEAGGKKHYTKYFKRHKRIGHKDLRGDHEDLEGNQNMIKDTLDAVEGNQAMTHEWLEKIETAIAELEPGEAGPVCPAGGTADASGRYKTYDADATDPKKVCDMNSGLFWEQSPDGVNQYNLDPGTAQAHCTAVGTGWRVPEIGELHDVVDYTTFNPAVNNSVFSNVQSSLYWSATSFAFNSTDAWVVTFINGFVLIDSKTDDHFVWCARSGS